MSNLVYPFTINYAMPNLRQKEVITSAMQRRIFNAALVDLVTAHINAVGIDDYLSHHELRLAHEHSLDIESDRDVEKIKSYWLISLKKSQTFKAKKKFIDANFVKFNVLFADAQANKTVLKFVFSEFIKNALKFAASSSTVEFYTANNRVTMVNSVAKRSAVGGSGKGKKLLHVYARKSGGIFEYARNDDDGTTVSTFDF